MIRALTTIETKDRVFAKGDAVTGIPEAHEKWLVESGYAERAAEVAKEKPKKEKKEMPKGDAADDIPRDA